MGAEKGGEIKMHTERHNQCIHCSVSSCKYHDAQDICGLDSIKVVAKNNCHNGCKDESMCGSYECCK